MSVTKTMQLALMNLLLLLTYLDASPQGTTQGSTPDKEDEGIQWSLGGGVVASPRPYVGTDTKVIPIPVVGLRYKRWFVQGIRGGFDLLQ